MRLAVLCFLFPVLAPAQTLVWEKPIAPGLVYREEVDLAAPRIVHALRWSPGSQAVRAVAELTGGRIVSEGSSTGRFPVSKMVERTKALAGVNADFFSMVTGQSGNPLGLMVRNGELITLPSNRGVFAWGQGEAAIGQAEFEGTIQPQSEAAFPLNGLNRACKKDEVVLYTPTAGAAVAEGAAIVITVKTDGATWSPSTRISGTVEAIGTEVPKAPISANQALLVGCGTRGEALAKLRPGTKLAVRLQTSGFDWEKVDNAVGGGPFLVRNGAVSVDAVAEGFPASFYAKRHPRTAIGRNRDGQVWLVAVDGRQEISDGATLDELARIMQRLGCVDALNLDGGGSTTMNVLGLTVNRPSDGKERPVANGIVLTGFPMPRAPMGKLRLGVAKPASDGTIQAMVLKERGETVNNAGVIWAATGAGWVDQGGLIRILGTGKCRLSAFVNGQTLSLDLDLKGKGKPKTRGKATADD